MRNLIRRWQIVSLVALAACTPSAKDLQISEAAKELALSSAARENGDYPIALKYAQKAVASNPGLAGAHFAVARIADDMCYPSANPGPDMRLCNLAMEEYRRVLQIDGSHQERQRIWRTCCGSLAGRDPKVTIGRR